MSENWLPVPGYEGSYEVSDCGRVRSYLRPPGIARVLTPVSRKLGHQYVALTRNGTTKTLAVHRLVLLAFVGPPPPRHITGHWDGNPANNHIGNLNWITYAQNEADRHRHGRVPFGELNCNAKLTADQVRDIRRRHQEGSAHRKLAREFKMSRPTISSIVNGLTWRHVDQGRVLPPVPVDRLF